MKKQLDQQRGDLPLDEFIIKVLDEHIKNKDRIDFSKYVFSSSKPEDDEVAELEEVDEAAEVTQVVKSEIIQSSFLEDFKDFAQNIYARLDRLEELLNDQETFLHGYSNPRYIAQDSDYGSSSEPKIRMEHTVPESGEVIIFEEVDDNEYDSDIVEPDAVEIEPEEDDEFEYGCPYCSATISEDATECPSCGNRFDDRAYDPTRVYSAIDVEPFSNGYSESGSYDPRPEYLKYHEIESISPSMDRTATASEYNDYSNSFKSQDKIRLCEMCGNKLSFVKSYKRWYCFTCKRYQGTLSVSADHAPIPPPTPPPASQPNSQESSPILSSATPTKHTHGAPSGFRELYTPRPDMDSMPPVKPLRNPSNAQPEPGYRKPYQNRKKPLKNYPIYED